MRTSTEICSAAPTHNTGTVVELGTGFPSSAFFIWLLGHSYSTLSSERSLFDHDGDVPLFQLKNLSFSERISREQV